MRLTDRDPAFREKLIDFGASAYIVRYHFGDRTITILAVRHGLELDRDD